MGLLFIKIRSEQVSSIYAPNLTTHHHHLIWSPYLTTYQLIDKTRPSTTFPSMPSKMRPWAFTPDFPLPAAAAAMKSRTSPAKTPWKNKVLKELKPVQVTHVLVNTFHALEYIGCQDSVPILRDSIDINHYRQRRFYFWGHIFVIVCNLKLKEHNVLFMKTVPDSAADYEQRGQLLDIFENVYLSLQKQFIGKICCYCRMWIDSHTCQEFLTVDQHAR